MALNPEDREAMRRLLGDEHLKIAHDDSLSTRGDAPDIAVLTDVQLLSAIRGCFVGVSLAMTDFQTMASRANALMGELVSRRGRATQPPPIEQAEPPTKKPRRRRGPPSEATKKLLREAWAARRRAKEAQA